MDIFNKKQPLDFRVKTTFGLAVTTLIFLLPFAVVQLVQGELLLGAISFIVIILFAINAWSCRQGRYNYMLTFVVLVPVMIIFFVYAFHEVGVISIFWCFPAVLAFYFMLPERLAWVANFFFIVIILPQAWEVLEFPLAIRLLVSLTMVSIFSAIFVRVISDQQKNLERQAQVDPLTGLLNRTLLHDSLEQVIAENHRSGTPTTLIAFDLDYFKQVNDSLGHSAGDKILSDIGAYLSERIRETDKVFRTGGEEFLVILNGVDDDEGSVLAEELRRSIAELPTLPDYRITVSLGVATLEASEGWDDWMKRCDENLYRAKNAGRNCVVS